MCDEELDLLRQLLSAFRYNDSERPTLRGYDVMTGEKVTIEVSEKLELLLDDVKQYLGED